MKEDCWLKALYLTCNIKLVDWMFLCWLHCQPGSAHVPLYCCSILSKRMTKVLPLFCKYSIIRLGLKTLFPWFPRPLLLVLHSPLMFCPCYSSNLPPPPHWSPLFQCSTPPAPLHSQQNSPPLLAEDAPSLMAFSNPQKLSLENSGIHTAHPFTSFQSEQPHWSCLFDIVPLFKSTQKSPRAKGRSYNCGLNTCSVTAVTWHCQKKRHGANSTFLRFSGQPWQSNIL